MDVPARLRLAIGVRIAARPSERGMLRIRRRGGIPHFAGLHPPHEHPRHDLLGRRGQVRHTRFHALLPFAQGRTLHASRTLPLRPVGQGKAAPAGTLRPCARLCPRPHGADRHARIHRKPQPLRPEEPALSLRLAAARKDRTAGGDRPRTRRILPAVAQRKSDSGGHRTRKTRILPHAGLLAQLDEPHEKVHLLQRRDRTEPADTETHVLLQRRRAGGPHDQSARKRRRRPQLGLPLLLAPRRFDVHRDALSHRTPRSGRPVHALHPVDVRQHARALPDHVRHPRRADIDRDYTGSSVGLQELQTRAHRQRCLPPAAERLVRIPDGSDLPILPPDAGFARRNRGHVGDGQEHSLDRDGRVAQTGQGNLGDPRPEPSVRLFESDVLGGVGSGREGRRPARQKRVRPPLAAGGRRHPRRRDEKRMEGGNRKFLASLRQPGAGLVAAAHGTLRFHRGDGPALQPNGKGGQGGAAARRPDVSLQQRGRFRYARIGLHDLHVLAHTRALRHRRAGGGPTVVRRSPALCQPRGVIQRRYRFRYERTARKFSAGLFASGTGQYRPPCSSRKRTEA